MLISRDLLKIVHKMITVNMSLKVSNVDDVLAYHTDFHNVCLADCMLTNPDLLKIVHKTITIVNISL